MCRIGSFVSLGVPCSKMVVCKKIQFYYLYRTTWGLILSVGCNLCFIPIYGIRGEAFATLVAQGSVGFVSLSIFNKTRHKFFVGCKIT